MKTLIISILIVLISITTISANKIVGSVLYNGKKYYVDVAATSTSATVWLRVAQYACSTGDLKALDLTPSKTTLKQAKLKICRANNVYNSGKTIAGCLSVAASGACAVGTAATDGAVAFLCTSTWVYAINKGLGDCIAGVADKIASELGNNEWASFVAMTGVGRGDIISVVSVAIDKVCKDAR